MGRRVRGVLAANQRRPARPVASRLHLTCLLQCTLLQFRFVTLSFQVFLSLQDFALCKYFLISYVHKCLVLSSYSNALCYNFDFSHLLSKHFSSPVLKELSDCMHIPIAFIIFQCKSQNCKMPQSKNPRLPG